MSTLRMCKIVAIGVATSALMVAAPTAANATVYTEIGNGCDTIDASTTLYYKNPHGNFNLRVWVSNPGWFTSNKYNISMYNNANTRVWSATGQTDRTYTIGGNVTKVELARNSWQGAVTCWQR